MRWPEVALLALLSTACAHTVAVGRPVVAPAPEGASAMQVRAAVLSGLTARGFTIVGERPGVIEARLDSRRVGVHLRVIFAADRYAIEYVDSAGLDAHQERGELRVSARYHRYVERLRASIDAAFTQPTAGGAVPPPPGYQVRAAPQPGGAAGGLGGPSPSPGGTRAGAPDVPPPPGSAPVTQPPAPPALAPPPLEPEQPPEPERRYETHPFYELVAIGSVVLGASWIGNIAASLAVGGSRNDYIGWGFAPLAGPWIQLSTLQWSIHPRWTGWFHPLMGLAQIGGLAMLVVGLVVPVHEDAPSSRAGEPTWRLAPMPLEGGAGLSVDLRL